MSICGPALRLEGKEPRMRVLPYFLLEIFLPGGTLLALALWLYRRSKAPVNSRR